jgi:hypothetical protein
MKPETGYRSRAWWLPLMTAAMALSIVWGCQASIKSVGPGKGLPFSEPLIILVTDPDGVGLSGATAVLFRQTTTGASWVKTVETNVAGDADFGEISETGSYLVYAFSAGYVGASSMALITESSILSADIVLAPVSNSVLKDIATETISSGGGTVSTALPSEQPQTLPVSTLTFPIGSVDDGTTVSVATLTGVQMPMPPEYQGALTVLRVDVTGNINAPATLEFGLPVVDIPLSTPIKTFEFNEARGDWTDIGVDAVVVETASGKAGRSSGTGAANVLAARMNVLLKSNSTAILAVFGLQTIKVTSVPVKTPSTNTGLEIVVRWIPTLTFPAGTDYPLQTQVWIQSVLESYIGLPFFEWAEFRLIRDPGSDSVLYDVLQDDSYTISYSFESVTSKTAGSGSVSAAGAPLEFYGESNDNESAEMVPIPHESGVGG